LPKPNCSKKSCLAFSADASREEGEEEEEEEESPRRRLFVLEPGRMEEDKRLLLLLLLLLLPRKDEEGEAQTWHELLILLLLVLGLQLFHLLLLLEKAQTSGCGRPKETDTALAAPATHVLVAAARIKKA